MKDVCIHCGYSILEHIDTTYSNINTDKCRIGQLTGDVYQCNNCEEIQIDNYLSNETEPFNY